MNGLRAELAAMRREKALADTAREAAEEQLAELRAVDGVFKALQGRDKTVAAQLAALGEGVAAAATSQQDAAEAAARARTGSLNVMMAAAEVPSKRSVVVVLA